MEKKYPAKNICRQLPDYLDLHEEAHAVKLKV